MTIQQNNNNNQSLTDLNLIYISAKSFREEVTRSIKESSKEKPKRLNKKSLIWKEYKEICAQKNCKVSLKWTSKMSVIQAAIDLIKIQKELNDAKESLNQIQEEIQEIQENPTLDNLSETNNDHVFNNMLRLRGGGGVFEAGHPATDDEMPDRGLRSVTAWLSDLTNVERIEVRKMANKDKDRIDLYAGRLNFKKWVPLRDAGDLPMLENMLRYMRSYVNVIANKDWPGRTIDSFRDTWFIRLTNDEGSASKTIKATGTLSEVVNAVAPHLNMPLGSSISRPHIFNIDLYHEPNWMRGGCTNSKNNNHTKKRKAICDGKKIQLETVCPASTNNNCAFACIKQLYKSQGKKLTDQYYVMRENCGIKHSQALTVQEFVQVATYYEININIYYTTSCNNLDIHYKHDQQHDWPELNVLYTWQDPVDEQGGGHYSMIMNINDYKLCENCGRVLLNKNNDHICQTDRVNHYQEKIIKKKHPLQFNGVKVNDISEEDIYGYDMETSTKLDMQDKQQPYAIYIQNYKDVNNNKLFQNEDKTVADLFNYLMNLDSNQKLIDQQQSIERKQYTILIIAYNGSRFDDSLLLKEIENYKTSTNPDFEYDFIPNNGRVMNLTWVNAKGITIRHFDLINFTQSSLRQAAINFNCNVQKGDFDHELINGWDSVKKYENQWKPYLIDDVKTMLEVYQKMDAAFHNITGFNNFPMYMTSSQLTYDMWLNNIHKSYKASDGSKKYKCKYNIHIPQGKLYENIKRSIHGGISIPLIENYKSKYAEEIDEIRINENMSEAERMNRLAKIFEEMQTNEDFMQLLDVVSLYPYAMTAFDNYPIGEPKLVDSQEGQTWIECKDGKEGFFHIDYIPPKNLRRTAVARNAEKGGKEYSLEPGCDWYARPDVERMLALGYQVKVREAWIYPTRGNPFKEYINSIFNIKKYHDYLKSGGSVDVLPAEFNGLPEKYGKNYNVVLREGCKLLMNGLFGKCIQKPNHTETKMIHHHNDWVSFLNKCELVDSVLVPTENGQFKVFVSGNKYNAKNTKPTQLGAYILANSRSVIYKYFLAIDPTLTTPTGYSGDTDSIFVDCSMYNKLKQYIGSDLGQLSVDTKGKGCIYKAVFLAPKQYMYKWINAKGETDAVIKCKGIMIKQLQNGKLVTLVTPEMYEEKKSVEREIYNIAKRHINLKPSDIRKEIMFGELTKEVVTRTFYKAAWNEQWYNEGEWYPIGYQKEKK